MSCYQPLFGGLSYFSVLSRCGFEEHGGVVDCIQPINLSGINQLLVPQRGAAMTRPQSLHELEELLEFPPHVSAAELDQRFQHLCSVLDKARDTFSCRVEEEEGNPFHEMRVQLQRAKDRFQARVVARAPALPGRLAPPPKAGAATSMTNPTAGDVNPVQELRDAFRMARKHFVPLLDQYVSNTAANQTLPSAPEKATADVAGKDCSATLTASDNSGAARPSPNAPDKIRSIPDWGPGKASRLEALITKELKKRRETAAVQCNALRKDDLSDAHMSFSWQATGPPAASEIGSDAFDRLSCTSQEIHHDGCGGCSPSLFARTKLSARSASSLQSDEFNYDLSSSSPSQSCEPVSIDSTFAISGTARQDRNKSPPAVAIVSSNKIVYEI